MSTKQVQIGPHTATARTLTIAEIRAWLREIGTSPADGQVDLIGETLFSEMTLRELAMVTDLQPLAIETLSPDALRPLIEVVCALNPQWIECRRRISDLGGRVREATAAAR